MQKKKSCGFVLLEAVMALIIVGIAAACVFKGLGTAAGLYRTALARTADIQKLEAAVNTLSETLRNSGSSGIVLNGSSLLIGSQVVLESVSSFSITRETKQAQNGSVVSAGYRASLTMMSDGQPLTRNWFVRSADIEQLAHPGKALML